MIVFIPRDSVPMGLFDFQQIVEREANPYSYTEPANVLRQNDWMKIKPGN